MSDCDGLARTDSDNDLKKCIPGLSLIHILLLDFLATLSEALI